MEQGYNVGSAIALGTSLQPDKTQPLTRGTGQWLQAEMNREAKKLKAEQERQKRAEMVSASWQGDGSDIPFVNEMMKQITNDFTMGSLDYINSGDLNGLQAFKREKFNELQRAKDIERQANKFFQDVKGTNLEGSAIVFANKGNEGLQIWAQENKDLSQQLRVEGGYQTHSPIKLDLNMGDIFDRVINRSQLPLNVEEGDFKRMFERTYRAQGEFNSKDIATMANGMAQSVKNVENYYVQNRNELRPIVEQKAMQYVNDGLDERSAIDKAKKEVVEERFNYELSLRNSRMIQANKPQPVNINIGNGVTKTVAQMNITPYDPIALKKMLQERDILNALRSGGTIDSQINSGAEIEKLASEEFANPYVIGVRSSAATGYIGLDGKVINKEIKPIDILMVTNQKTGEQKYYIYGISSNIIGEKTAQLLPLNDINFSKISTYATDGDLKSAPVLYDLIMKSFDIQGEEYKANFPRPKGSAGINQKSREMQTNTPQNTSGGGGSGSKNPPLIDPSVKPR
jgi:hypothetical protein